MFLTAMFLTAMFSTTIESWFADRRRGASGASQSG
jgi:hypothetical protein